MRRDSRSEEHTSELQSHDNLVCRLLLEKKTIQLRPRTLARLDTHTAWRTRRCDVAHAVLEQRAGGLAQRSALHGAADGVFFFKYAGDPEFHPPPLPHRHPD